MSKLRLTVARNPEHFDDAERLRLAVYCDEEQMFSAPAAATARATPRAELAPGAELVQLLVYAESEPVGAVRLSLAHDCGPTVAAPDRLGLDSKFVLAGFDRPGLVLGEISGYCVRARFRGTRVTPALFAALRVESERRRVTHWVAAANMETDCAEDAELVHRLLGARNLMSDAYRARACMNKLAPEQARRALYTREERARAHHGELSALKLPRTLALFANKMGARYIGPPAFDRSFNVFAAPLVVQLASTAIARGPARALESLLALEASAAP